MKNEKIEIENIQISEINKKPIVFAPYNNTPTLTLMKSESKKIQIKNKNTNKKITIKADEEDDLLMPVILFLEDAKIGFNEEKYYTKLGERNKLTETLWKEYERKKNKLQKIGIEEKRITEIIEKLNEKLYETYES